LKLLKKISSKFWGLPGTIKGMFLFREGRWHSTEKGPCHPLHLPPFPAVSQRVVKTHFQVLQTMIGNCLAVHLSLKSWWPNFSLHPVLYFLEVINEESSSIDSGEAQLIYNGLISFCSSIIFQFSGVFFSYFFF
jgi:hypothetical protein